MSSRSKKNNAMKKKGEARAIKSGRDTGVKYSAKRKIPLTLLLSLVAPLTVCVFGPFETYSGNMGEFLFSLGDFLPLCILYSLAVSAVIFAVLMLLDGRAYDIACAVVLWLSECFLRRGIILIWA